MCRRRRRRVRLNFCDTAPISWIYMYLFCSIQKYKSTVNTSIMISHIYLWKHANSGIQLFTIFQDFLKNDLVKSKFFKYDILWKNVNSRFFMKYHDMWRTLIWRDRFKKPQFSGSLLEIQKIYLMMFSLYGSHLPCPWIWMDLERKTKIKDPFSLPHFFMKISWKYHEKSWYFFMK